MNAFIEKANPGINLEHNLIETPCSVKGFLNTLQNNMLNPSRSSFLKILNDIRLTKQANKVFRKNLKSTVKKLGFAIIKGLPQDKDLVPTPTHFQNTIQKETYHSETNLLYLSSIFGSIKTYDQEYDGALVHNIYPVLTNKSLAAGTGSDIDLDFHTEVAFDINRPDYLILICLRAGGITTPTILSENLEHAIGKLTQKEINRLTNNVFFIRQPYSFSRSDNVFYRQPLIHYKNGKAIFTFNFNDSVVYCSDTATRETLKKLHKILKAGQSKTYLEPGMAIVIDNNQFLHARAKYKPLFDGADRWLQRVYVSKEANL